MLKTIKSLLSLKAISEATQIPYETMSSYAVGRRVMNEVNRKKIVKYLKSALKEIEKTF